MPHYFLIDSKKKRFSLIQFSLVQGAEMPLFKTIQVNPDYHCAKKFKPSKLTI